MNSRPQWKSLNTAEKIDAIRAFWFSGCSTREIAASMEGVTRNAIIGMYHRFPNSLTDKPLVKRGIIDDVAAKSRKDRKRRAPVTFLFADKTSKPLPQPVEIAFEYRLCGKPLLKLGANECKWSINDASGEDLHLFCALPADGSYCHHHKTRAHQPAK